MKTSSVELNSRGTVMRVIAPVALLLLMALAAAGQRVERVVDSWKPLHYDVDLSFDDQLTELKSARTRISVQVLAPTLNKIDLDFGELPIDSVTVSEKSARFERTA